MDSDKDVRIGVCRFLFTIIPDEVLILPAYKGSTLRGGFGYAFRRVVCALRKNDCGECILKEKCVYSYVFETPPPSDTKVMRKYKAAPHPFVIEPPPEKRRGYKPGDPITFGLVLIGRAIDYLPYFIYTFDELGRMGIGRDKAKFSLQEVSFLGERIYDAGTKTLKPVKTDDLSVLLPTNGNGTLKSAHVTLNFLTPTRLSFNSRIATDMEFHILIRNLLRRLSLLNYFHCSSDSQDWDFKGIISRAEEVSIGESKLSWYDLERYSTRQDATMKMGGFVGEITFEGDLEPFISLLKAGEQIHVGKGTSFGLGRYEIGETGGDK